MTASQVLRRLARNGFWLDATQVDAGQWIRESAAFLGVTLAEAATRLARPLDSAKAVIRREWYANVLWYTKPISFVLERCQAVSPETTVVVALDLREQDSELPVAMPAPGGKPSQDGLVLAGDWPVAVNAVPKAESTRGVSPPRKLPPADLGPMRGRPTPRKTPESTRVETWPRLKALSYVPAGTQFSVEIGFSHDRQQGTTGNRISLPAQPGQKEILLTVELTAHGLTAPGGWTSPLLVTLANPTSASVRFELIGLDPPKPSPVLLTTLEVRYLLPNGEVCGTISKPLVIGLPEQPALDLPAHYGTPWLSQPVTASEVSITPGSEPPDLTIELIKPDRNPALGFYECRLRSPHRLTVNRGPFTIDFGEDAKTFARTIVDRIRLYGSSALADNYFRSVGIIIAEKLPQEAHDALREVAAIKAPRPPSVLLVSAEPYVPWELAYLEPPLDPTRPPYLGAQVVLGRWIRNRSDVVASASVVVGGTVRIEKPPANPPAEIAVKHMAVVAGVYKAQSGFRSLPEAETEAASLVSIYGAIPLAASAQAMSQLLDAKLEHNSRVVGGADVVHFAGHGEFDPNRPDSSVLFLSDGMPLSSDLFRGAKYGAGKQPLIFLNACMVGIGGEMLGDMGGFPGNCLKGGFGGVLGALWEVNDAVAHSIALEFWKRVMPADGNPGEPVAEVLRDIRATYGQPTLPRVPTYLAYVYYGHPHLKLRRINEEH
jgi:hypothetical protein